MNIKLLEKLAQQAGFGVDNDFDCPTVIYGGDAFRRVTDEVEALVRLVAEQCVQEVLALHPSYVPDSECRGTLDRCAYVIRSKFHLPGAWPSNEAPS